MGVTKAAVAAGVGSKIIDTAVKGYVDIETSRIQKEAERRWAQAEEKIAVLTTQMQEAVAEIKAEAKIQVAEIERVMRETVALTVARAQVGTAWVDEGSEIISVADRPISRTTETSKDGLKTHKNDISLLDTIYFMYQLGKVGKTAAKRVKSSTHWAKAAREIEQDTIMEDYFTEIETEALEDFRALTRINITAAGDVVDTGIQNTKSTAPNYGNYTLAQEAFSTAAEKIVDAARRPFGY